MGRLFALINNVELMVTPPDLEFAGICPLAAFILYWNINKQKYILSHRLYNLEYMNEWE
ncbi:hypothetical protein YDYSG_50720 [Paenibacillus tyrfis]|nr:hypothetical protein YDYSG_50720 [Paenibacillus tyrfis]